MSFPASPVLNEIFIADGKAWKFDGTNWVIPKKPLPEWDEIRNKPVYFNAKVISSAMPPTNQVDGTLWWDETNKRLYVWQLGVWIETAPAVRGKYISTDPDVINYIEAVEAADGEPLEPAVVTELEAFILGCKVDGIWDAIGSSCIFAGARTFNGAIRTLAGPTLTLNGLATSSPTFESTYNRKTGFASWGAPYQQQILTNFYTNQGGSPTNRHCAVWLTEPNTNTSTITPPYEHIIGATHFYSRGFVIAADSSTGNYYVSVHGAGVDTGISYTTGLNFVGISRNDSTFFNFRNANINYPFFINSSNIVANYNVPIKSATFIENATKWGSDARIAFYSVGEYLDLTLLDARVTKLMTKLNTILP